MRMVNRTVEITYGDILIGEQSVRDREPAQLRREIGYVIQQIGLFPHRTIAENIGAVPSCSAGRRTGSAPARAELLELIGLDPELGDRYPAQLSGGQQQRVGVARALAADPLVMLMDEPFGAIDPINRERLQNEFLRLQAEIRKTVLFVTHDIDEAIKMGDRIAVMREGGRVEQYATPAELLMAPATEFVEDFVGADRALKRLALMRVGDIDLWEAPLGHRRPADRRGAGEARRARRRSPLPAAGRRRAAARSAGSPSATCAADTVPEPPRLAARPGARPRRRDARRARRPAPGRVPVRRRWSTAGGRIAGVLSVEIISEFLASPEAKTDEHGAVERPHERRRSRGSRPLAGRRSAKSAKGSSTNGPKATCPARRSQTTSSAGTGRGKTSTATGRRPLQHLELVVISVV